MAIVRRYRARAERRRRRHQRLYRPRVILNDFRDRDVFPRFRFMRETVVFLINMFAPALGTPTMRSCPIPAATQVMAALRFFATGAHFRLVGDSLRVSEASVSGAVYRVTSILCRMAPLFIKFPAPPDARAVKQAFHKIAGERECIEILMIYKSKAIDLILNLVLIRNRAYINYILQTTVVKY